VRSAEAELFGDRDLNAAINSRAAREPRDTFVLVTRNTVHNEAKYRANYLALSSGMLNKLSGLEWAEEVKAFRVANGLTQEEFAPLAGVSKTTVQNWENGRVGRVPNRTKARVRAAFGASGGSDVQTRGSKARRYSGEAIAALHQALDMILDNADSTVVQSVTELLTKFAGRFGDTRERLGRLPSRREKARIK
jgi:DNA-binding transcriptional regulator YiaG